MLTVVSHGCNRALIRKQVSHAFGQCPCIARLHKNAGSPVI